MTSRSMANQAELAAQMFYQSRGFVTDKARNQVIIGPGGRPMSVAYDFLKAFDIIGIGPEGVLFSQVTMGETQLWTKRDKITHLPWPQKSHGVIITEVVFAEKVRHPVRTREKCWRFSIQRYDIEARTWPRRDSDEIQWIFFDEKEGKVIPQAML